MILHQGDRYVCNGTQVHPGSLNFLKSSLEIGVVSIGNLVSACLSHQTLKRAIFKNNLLIFFRFRLMYGQE